MTKMGLNHFRMGVTFQYRGFNHLEWYCALIIEAWLKLNIRFDCRYLELLNACLSHDVGYGMHKNREITNGLQILVTLCTCVLKFVITSRMAIS